MNALAIILKKVLYIPYMWFWMIPIRLGAVAFLAYFGLMFMIYGTLQPTEIQNFLESNGWDMVYGFLIPFGMPVFLSLGTMFGFSGAHNAPSPSALDQAIQFRNGQMSVSSDKDAAEILQKTSHLDAMKVYGSMGVMQSAERGFNATYGASSPTKVYKDIMKK